MTRAGSKLLTAALELPEAERLALATELIASLDGPAHSDWEATWMSEIDARIRASDARGEPAEDWTALRARVLARLSQR